MDVIEYKNHKEIRRDIEPLYISAFPEEERPPIEMYFHSFEIEGNELFGFYIDKTFIGFTSVKIYKDICYFFFLAVKEEYRNRGYGSEILSYLKERYKKYILLLCYEEVNTKYPDYPLRKRREELYKRHGFTDNHLLTIEAGVTYQTMKIGHRDVTYEEYAEIFKLGFDENAIKYLRKHQ